MKDELIASIWKRAPYGGCPEGEWVLEIAGVIDEVDFVSRHTEPLTTAKSDVAGLPSLYAVTQGTADNERVKALEEQVRLLTAQCGVYRDALGLTEIERKPDGPVT